MKNNLPVSTILDKATVADLKPDFDMLKIIPFQVAQQTQTLVFDHEGKTLCVLTTNTFPHLVSQIIEKLVAKGYKTRFLYTDDEGFITALGRYKQMQQVEQTEFEKKEHRKKALGVDAQQLIHQLFISRDGLSEGDFIKEMIRLSFAAGASDLHFQPEAVGIVMRIRLDGVLTTMEVFNPKDFVKYLMKLKFMAGVKLNIDYVPQDGRFDFEVAREDTTKKIDVRVNFMPTLRGESIVMRFLDSDKSLQSFSSIGFADNSLHMLQTELGRSYGMILVTGPTGSGKTTTLYSMLQYLNEPGKKIITLEDPVEYELAGIQQSQINEKKGYTYVDGLKAILRQDPEVIMVGEIRTPETAEIAINAALTGHLVISTIHTNTAIEAINRLLTMGIPPYLLGPAINLIIGQRLVRRVHSCAGKRPALLAESNEIGSHLSRINNISKEKYEFSGTLYEPLGCAECNTMGYKGRVACTEMFSVTDDIKEMITAGKSTLEVYSQARHNGFLTMKEDGILKVIRGVTTLEEVRIVLA